MVTRRPYATITISCAQRRRAIAGVLRRLYGRLRLRLTRKDCVAPRRRGRPRYSLDDKGGRVAKLASRQAMRVQDKCALTCDSEERASPSCRRLRRYITVEGLISLGERPKIFVRLDCWIRSASIAAAQEWRQGTTGTLGQAPAQPRGARQLAATVGQWRRPRSSRPRSHQ